jgi:ankyrin repeat protein
LYDAARDNDTALVLKLLKQGAELEWRNPDGWGDGMTALAVACACGSYEAAEALCAHGAELDARTNSQCTPLIFAAFNGKTKICEMLLALGADPSLKHEDGETALDRARQNNEPECAALLQPVTPGA